MEAMWDLRCPSCNLPMIGDEDVTFRKRAPRVNECPHCETPVRISSSVREMGGYEIFSYEKDTEIGVA